MEDNLELAQLLKKFLLKEGVTHTKKKLLNNLIPTPFIHPLKVYWIHSIITR
jgi:hypothetical protein